MISAESNPWEKIAEGIHLFRDSCNVYAVQGPSGIVVVNAGTGLAANHLSAINPIGPVTVLLTHAFRDHSDGAIAFHKQGARILANYWDRNYYLDPEQHFRERQHYVLYDNRWDRFNPIRPIPINDWLMDYEVRNVAGLKWEVIPTPGAATAASSYAVTVNGLRWIFSGETICGMGKTGRLAPHQYNYNDITGIKNLWHSNQRIMEAKPDKILPSLGHPIEDPKAASDALAHNLKELHTIHSGTRESLSKPDDDDIKEVLPRLFHSVHSSANTFFIVSKSGKVLALDYGANRNQFHSPAKYHFSTRRPLLHGIKGLKKRFGIDRIDTVLVTHFHDDHVSGIPMLQRLYGTKVWAAQHFSDVLENPDRYDRPCLWPEPIKVDQHLPINETIEWEDITFSLHPMSGHTRFATLICLTVDGVRIAHTSDQINFKTQKGGHTSFAQTGKLFTNHVYKNGLELGCYHETLRQLQAFRPQWSISGHTTPYEITDSYYEIIERGADDFDRTHKSLMFLEDSDVHFGVESQAAKLKPYRVHIDAGKDAEFEGWVINPFPTAQEAKLKLIGPEGWKSDEVQISLQGREQKSIRVSITPPTDAKVRMQPVALDLTVGERPFGQVTEALVTVGCDTF